MFATVSTAFAQKKKAVTKNTKTSYKKYVASVEKKSKDATDTRKFYSAQEDSLRLAADSLDLVLLDSTRQVWLDSMYTITNEAGMENAKNISMSQTARDQKETQIINSLRKLKLSTTYVTRVRTATSMYYDELELINLNQDMMDVDKAQKIAALNENRNLKLKTIIGSKKYKKWLKENTPEAVAMTKEN